MNKILKSTLQLNRISQIGIVVKDLKKAIKYYEGKFGFSFVQPVIKYREIYYYNKLVDAEWLFGFCSLGLLEFELIQPVKGPSIQEDFLKKNGNKIHHIGFEVNDIEEEVRKSKKLGFEVIQYGTTLDSAKFAYLDTAKFGGCLIELMQRTKRRA